MTDAQILIVVPTYNERENLPGFVAALLALPQQIECLIVDDNSPDGTGKIADELVKASQRVHVLHRPGKQGLGAAYVAGFVWALERNYQFVVSMDADFSHDPAQLPTLLAVRDKQVVVIGSRYVKGGRIVGWDWRRYLNSWGANWVTRLLLGLPVRDATAGFKCYPRSFLADLDLGQLLASGYAFQVEMLLRAQELGYRLCEVPIIFVDRRAGQSKISGELVSSAKVVLRLAAQRPGLKQFIKFALVGGLNTIVDWCIYFLLWRSGLSRLGQNGKQLAKAGSFLVAVISSYILNRAWTFRSQDKRIARQATRFFLVAAVGLLLNNSIFYFLTAPNYFHLSDLISLALTTAGIMFWNFFANKYWTFRAEPEKR
jgi:dolichol-phosphate mannosyltransferase